jgi:2-(1,2-epoxy-1,2-dihydrophenyl)acetyl-CoA isomerase
MSIVRLEITGSIATLTLCRPQSLNALGQDGDGQDFRAACEKINADKSLRAVVLAAEGRAFSAGGDLKAMQAKHGNFAGSPSDIADAYKSNIHLIIRSLWGIEVPVISAINGPAIGLGCDVACMGDIRIASKDAKFGLTFLKIGLIPGDGGAWLSPRIMGMARAAELLFTGDVIDAAKALEWGIVSDVVEADELMDAAYAMATRVAKQPPLALRATKALLRQGQNTNFDTILELSAATQGLMHNTEDHIEGVAAILEKRAPHFTGR